MNGTLWHKYLEDSWANLRYVINEWPLTLPNIASDVIHECPLPVQLDLLRCLALAIHSLEACLTSPNISPSAPKMKKANQ